MNDTADRMPPYNEKAEIGVIGSMVQDNGLIDDIQATGLKPEDFFTESAILFCKAIYDLYALGVVVDTISLSEHMTRRGMYKRAGGDDRLTDIMLATPQNADGVYHANIVRQLADARRLIHVCEETLREAYARKLDSQALIGRAEMRILDLAQEASIKSEIGTVGDAAREAMDRIRERRERDAEPMGVPSGLFGLDSVTDGFQPGNLIILAARTSVGKSAAALNFAEHAAVDRGKRVLFVSMEMTNTELGLRLLSARSKVDSHSLMVGLPIGEDEQADLDRAFEDLKACGNFWLDDEPIRSVNRIGANARRIQGRFGLDLLIVDYLQLIDSTSDLPRASREERVAYVSRRLKAIAKQLNIPVIALSQLNRESEKRPDGRPKIADLRESGSLEQDANMVLLLHRPDMVKADAPPGEAELIIAKNRGGPLGVVKLTYEGATLRFKDRVEPDPYIPPNAKHFPGENGTLKVHKPVAAYADEVEDDDEFTTPYF